MNEKYISNNELHLNYMILYEHIMGYKYFIKILTKFFCIIILDVLI